MRKLILSFVFISILWGCKTTQKAVPGTTNKLQAEVNVTIDLNTIKNDKVMVTVQPTGINQEEIVFNIPKTVPGTYSLDNYGKYIEDVSAVDKNGKPLKVVKKGENSWNISDAKKLDKIIYWVNDTYDTESGMGFGTKDVFSPAGSNISKDNFMVNTHAFVGYFSGLVEASYTTTVLHSANLYGATAMNDLDNSDTKDVFKNYRYADLVEHPIMYCKPDYTTFKIDDMEIIISIYSPSGAYKVSDIAPDLETMMRAQKRFLGGFNNTKKYAVLLYLSDISKADAKGFGALEHPTSTTVVMPEILPKDQMAETLKDVVSHEFFHIVTPLGVHSKEIHDFDFNDPKMSKHLWMYEGVTEYFSNLFQINQGLISEEAFYKRMSDKITNASALNDTMSFTKMSANVLEEPYKAQYLNVYQKGALIGMCIDIILREKSNGERGILDLMQKLTAEYGSKKPFNDDALFDTIEQFTYPEVKSFLETYVNGTTPIPYDEYFAKVGLTKTKKQVAGNLFLKGEEPYISFNASTKEILIPKEVESLPSFYSDLGFKKGDIITEINGTKYNLDNVYELITTSQTWKENDPISFKIKRDATESILKGIVKLPYETVEGYSETDHSKEKIKNAWLKG